jgi:hypothetical protein
MSYINKQKTNLVRVKLTEEGRRLLATGQLNFDSYYLGDTEVDYDYVRGWKDFQPKSNAATGQFLVHLNNGTVISDNYAKVLSPKDRQPFGTSFVYNPNTTGVTFKLSTESTLEIIKGIVSNQAEQRGFFTGDSINGLTAYTNSDFVKFSGVINLGKFSGETDITTFTKGVLRFDELLTNVSQDDYIMFKFSNNTLGTNTGATLSVPTVNTFYNITDITNTTTSVIKVDRALPVLTASTGVYITYFIIPGGNSPIDDYYSLGSTTAYWNTGTLSFNSSCDICVDNIPVWNMNNFWYENMAGQYSDNIDIYHTHNLFGSEDYTGTGRFLKLDALKNTTEAAYSVSNTCDVTTLMSYIDPFQKGVSIIHYTNNAISNFYGEFFHVDATLNKKVEIDMPIMWHNRNYATATGTTMGMKFVSDTTLKTIENTNIQYYDLIEYSGLSNTPSKLISVGYVFPQLKIIAITHEELLASISYKSNRNWTLPDLSVNSVTPVNGTGTGVLKPGQRLYVTYYMTANSGATTETLPCQRYAYLDNPTTMDLDVEFKINNLNNLPYMRKVESGSYDGKGWYANNFYVLAQITSGTTRPNSNGWYEIDFTSTAITTNVNATINPILLERQTPSLNGFVIDGPTYSASSIFNLGGLMSLPKGIYYQKMTFGDERLFYGNLNTHIGATIYKSLFSINIDGIEVTNSTNPTYTNGKDRYITEIGILSSSGVLVMEGKLSRPIKISDATRASIEMTMDF